jgi:hypothetical protein
LAAQAASELREDLYGIWEKIMAPGEVEPAGYRQFFAPFIGYAEKLLKIEISKLSRAPLRKVIAKVNGLWPDGKVEGLGLKAEVVLRIAPMPPFCAGGKASQRLLNLRLFMEPLFTENASERHLPPALIQAALDVGLENDSNLFDKLRWLPHRCIGEWFKHLCGTMGVVRKPSVDTAELTEVCRNFSLVMLDYGVWKEFYDKCLARLATHAEKLLSERALREMKLRTKPRQVILDPRWVTRVTEVLGSEPRNREACEFLDNRQIALPLRVRWKDKQGHPAATWMQAFEGCRSLVESYLSKFRERRVSR